MNDTEIFCTLFSQDIFFLWALFLDKKSPQQRLKKRVLQYNQKHHFFLSFCCKLNSSLLLRCLLSRWWFTHTHYTS